MFGYSHMISDSDSDSDSEDGDEDDPLQIDDDEDLEVATNAHMPEDSAPTRLQYDYYIYNGYLVITRPWFGFNHSRITMVWVVISNNQPIYLKPTRSTIRSSIPYSI
jgi:hypothetical protein